MDNNLSNQQKYRFIQACKIVKSTITKCVIKVECIVNTMLKNNNICNC